MCNMARRAGVSRGVIFRGQGEVGAKLKLNTDVRLAPFNVDLLWISSYEFPRDRLGPMLII